MSETRTREPSIAEIQSVVCEEFRLSLPTMLSPVRAAYASQPRHVAMWLACKLTSKSMKVVGRSFKRDRSTIFHAIAAVEQHIHLADKWGTTAVELYRRYSPISTLSPLNSCSIGVEKCVGSLSSHIAEVGL